MGYQYILGFYDTILERFSDDNKFEYDIKTPLPVACSENGLLLIQERAEGKSITKILKETDSTKGHFDQLYQFFDAIQMTLLFVSIQQNNLTSTTGSVMHTDLHPGNVLFRRLPADENGK